MINGLKKFVLTAFRMSSLDVFVRLLESKGIEYERKYLADTHLIQLFFYDPAGIQLEVNFHQES